MKKMERIIKTKFRKLTLDETSKVAGAGGSSKRTVSGGTGHGDVEYSSDF